MEKENFSDDDLARLTAESAQWAGRGSLKIAMVVLQTVFLLNMFATAPAKEMLMKLKL